MKEKQAAVQTAEDIAKSIAEDIGTKAYYALLEEVYTTPKPGLVDLYSCGAHTDMNVQTFEKSAEALRPWFIRMAAQGYLLTCTREDLFVEIRKTGILAEKAMFDSKADGRIVTFSAPMTKESSPALFFYKLGFRFTSPEANNYMEECIIKKIPDIPAQVGMMYLPKCRLHKLLRYGELF